MGLTTVAGSMTLWGGQFSQSDLLMAYLPLAHILEQVRAGSMALAAAPVAKPRADCVVFGIHLLFDGDPDRLCDGQDAAG